MRKFPRRLEWGPAADRADYGFHKARVPNFCHHRPALDGAPLLGPCVRHIHPGEFYLSADQGPPARRTLIAFRCAVHSGLLLDTRLTPPLIETLFCAEYGILNWYPGTGVGMDVWVTGDNGTANFSQAAQDAAGWLRRNGLAQIDESYPDLIVPTIAGHQELAAWRHDQMRRPL